MKKKTYISPLCKTYPLAEQIEFLALSKGEKPKPKPVQPSNPSFIIDNDKVIDNPNNIF